MSAIAPLAHLPAPASQFNWVTGSFDQPCEQLDLALPPFEPDVLLPHDQTVTLLATESGAQLVISGFGLYLGKKSERIVVRHEGKVCAQLPLMRLQEVIVASRGVSVSSDLIEELCARGVRLAFLTSSGKPSALVTSPLLTATVATRRAQLLATTSEIGADFARRVIAGKLRNQDRLLRYFAKSRSAAAAQGLSKASAQIGALVKVALKTKGDSPEAVRGRLMGLEGTAGRLYWEQMANIVPGFEKRLHNAASSPANAAINYGYGILYAHVWGAAMNAGLEPFAGFLHTDRSGKPSLVLDLVEEFRQPIVDRAVFGWLNRGGKITLSGGMLDGESKEEVAARVLQRLNSEETYRAQTYQVRSIIQMQARSAAQLFRGSGRYRPFAFAW
jgi:CRISPR-associated protein Cas1